MGLRVKFLNCFLNSHSSDICIMFYNCLKEKVKTQKCSFFRLIVTLKNAYALINFIFGLLKLFFKFSFK